MSEKLLKRVASETKYVKSSVVIHWIYKKIIFLKDIKNVLKAVKVF